MIDDDVYNFYRINSVTNKLNFDITHYCYVTLRDAFAMSGVDIQSIKNEDELNRVWAELSDNVMQIVITRALNRDPNNLENALIQAHIRDDNEKADHIREKLRKQKNLSLRVITNKPAH